MSKTVNNEHFNESIIMFLDINLAGAHNCLLTPALSFLYIGSNPCMS